ncbi:hypothetical protein GW933_01340 [Candidatus Falkowbacteria bacterium]|uniref:Uncharacterized protein n=1 Tax=Candidatus Buchananbacteria bacterium CG10_big_fil_rev_8_21_14_0_10_33_19 TaxID=1974525 RepID=A0A2H0W3F6_9BACT|nr:hypothetical protein [Candidatus Falkowbacteria bacterium]PIS05898.1 MAG: hypothetical protein COT80_03970 [Candidatus Buchananbacteria bacterium CG10_big_fil_rev_8_21_14_0_10_33_19]
MLNEENNNFTDKEIKFSYWYVTHKLLLRNIFIIFLGVVGFLIWFYVVWQLVFWGLSYSIENNQLRKLVFGGNLALSAINQLKPKTLQVGDPIALIGEASRNDYFAEITNNNNDWLATFDYVFNSGESAIVYKGFSLPLEKKYLMSLGIADNVSDLNITNIKWQRVPNAKNIYAERYQFKIENNNFIASTKADEPGVLNFDIVNNSAFNYWQVGVQVFLYSGGKVVSVNYLILEQLKTGERRNIQLNWNNKLPRISSMDIIPEVNVFDADNIMPQSAPIDFPIT